MPKVLTTASTVLCGPLPTHGGTVVTQSSARLTIGGAPVLVTSSVEMKPVGSCAVADTPQTDPCTEVASVKPTSLSTKLTVGGQAVLLETLSGDTNGDPVGPLQAVAEHQRLTAT
jgi:hypothetical protein